MRDSLRPFEVPAGAASLVVVALGVAGVVSAVLDVLALATMRTDGPYGDTAALSMLAFGFVVLPVALLAAVLASLSGVAAMQGRRVKGWRWAQIVVNSAAAFCLALAAFVGFPVLNMFLFTGQYGPARAMTPEWVVASALAVLVFFGLFLWVRVPKPVQDGR